MTHPELVKALVKPGSQIQSELTSNDCNLLHMTLGICGEAGELLDSVKKNTIYRKTLDMENIVEELGDIEFYLEGLRQELGISRQECLNHNIAKLSKRYSSMQYSDRQAQDRADKDE